MKRALVLCGGGSLGSYEIGAWRYFREAGINFDIVTGTSIGAINGALVCTGDYEKAAELWSKVDSSEVMKNGFNIDENTLHEIKGLQLRAFFGNYVKNRGADITPFLKLVKSTVDPHKVKMSKMKFAIVTCVYPSIKERDVIVNDLPENQIIPYLHASSACFPIFPLYQIGKEKFMDGGYRNNLPIDLAIKLGADEIVAVFLRSVPKVAQHDELRSMPFVKMVQPVVDTGSIMNFQVTTVLNNMELGYNDAGKAYGKYDGFVYTFEKEGFSTTIEHSFVHDLLAANIGSYSAIVKVLRGATYIPKTEHEFFICSQENVASWLGVNYIKIYKIDDFVAIWDSAVKTLSIDREIYEMAMSDSFEGAATDSKIKAFFVYVRYLLVNGLSLDLANKATKKHAEYAIILQLYNSMFKSGAIQR